MRNSDKREIRILFANLDSKVNNLLACESDVRMVTKPKFDQHVEIFDVIASITRMIVSIEVPHLYKIMSRREIRLVEIKNVIKVTRPKTFEQHVRTIRDSTAMPAELSLDLRKTLDFIIDIKHTLYAIAVSQYIGMRSFRELGCFNVKDKQFLDDIVSEVDVHRYYKIYHEIKYFSN